MPESAPAVPPADAAAFQTPWRRDLTRLSLLLLALLAWDATGWDLTVSQWFGTPQGFPWREAWLTRTLGHEGGRMFAWAVLGVMVWDAWRTGRRERQAALLGRTVAAGAGSASAGPPAAARWLTCALVLIGAIWVPLLKRFTLTSCPWDQSAFGGVAQYVSHWQWGVLDGGPGHCFPSGHAVSVFAFITVAFLWRPYRPQWARGLIGVILLLGAVFGFVQLVRGAHYVSHTLWSGWLCAAFAVAVQGLQRRAAAQAPDQAG